jgi:hypothetical protein
MYRATHIYLLFSALLNLLAAGFDSVSTHAPASARGLVAWLDRTGRVLLLLAPPTFLLAFFVEPPVYAIERPLSFWGVVACAAGVGLLAIARWLPLERWLTLRRAARAEGPPPT